MFTLPSVQKLQTLRTKIGKPMIVTSAYRTEGHNKAVNGAKDSQHLEAKAFDIAMTNHNPDAFARAARDCGFRGVAYYRKDNFMHIDTGPERTWGNPIPKRQRFAVEPVGRQFKIQSRTMQGGLAVIAAQIPAVGGALGVLERLDQITQYILVGGGVAIALVAAVVILKERSRKWNEGER